jgi:serine-type D-Ala-D-Ala carboxypeptidase (penicillin-binding protein 5/6)
MMKKLILISVLLILAASFAENNKFGKKTDFTKPFESKFKDYKAVMLVDLTNNRVFYEQNAYSTLEIASVTKMMPMLLVVEEMEKGRLSLSDTLTASTAASKIGGSQIYLREWEKMTVEDLFKAVVIKSANDATTVLAERIGGQGGMDLFIKMMNSRAKQLGMNNTHFDFPHGLPPSKKNKAKNMKPNTSTCYDLVLLAEELLKYPVILKYSSTWMDYVRHGKDKFELRNTSRLIRDYPYFDGLKTGYYEKAGFSIVATAKIDDARLVAVVLGTKSMKGRDKFINSLVTWGFSEIEAEKKAAEASSTDDAHSVSPK